jgi:hypothetical protein
VTSIPLLLKPWDLVTQDEVLPAWENVLTWEGIAKRGVCERSQARDVIIECRSHKRAVIRNEMASARGESAGGRGCLQLEYERYQSLARRGLEPFSRHSARDPIAEISNALN